MPGRFIYLLLQSVVAMIQIGDDGPRWSGFLNENQVVESVWGDSCSWMEATLSKR